MISRSIYLAPLLLSLGTPVIKVITGMRRVGKSTLLLQFIEALHDRGIDSSQIFFLDREDFRWEGVRSAPDLYRVIEEYFSPLLHHSGEASQQKYICIDEIQDIADWESVIRHYGKLQEYEIYITGSNSTLLSSELSTYLSGRYMEFPVFPLSYQEFLQFRPEGNLGEYMRYGGLPAVALLPDHLRKGYIDGVLNTVLIRDVIDRYQIRNGSLLTDILRYIAANIGYPTSTNKIAQYLKKERISLAFETVREYLLYFRRSFILHTPSWSDILGKRFLDLHEKYYFSDIGLRNSLVGYRDEYIGQILENIVYNELIVRGYRVMVGRIGEKEIDFIAEYEGGRLYIQVTYLLATPETVDREFSPLESIPDNYPKYVLSLDREWGTGRNGIHRIHIEDWLLKKNTSYIDTL